MDAQAVIAVSASVVALIQILKATGLTGRWALVTSAVLSAVGVALWGYSVGTFARTQTFEYFAAWIAVLTSAAGAFGIVNGGAEAVTSVKGAGAAIVKSLTTGTGKG